MRRNPTCLRLDEILKFSRCHASLAYENSIISRQILLATGLNHAACSCRIKFYNFKNPQRCLFRICYATCFAPLILSPLVSLPFRTCRTAYRTTHFDAGRPPPATHESSIIRRKISLATGLSCAGIIRCSTSRLNLKFHSNFHLSSR